MQKIYTRQLGFYLFIAIPLTKLIMLPALLFAQTGSLSIILVLIYFILDLSLLFLIFYMRKLTNGKSIFHVLESVITPTGTRIFAFLYALFFMIKSFYILAEQKLFLGEVFYEMLPQSFLLIPIVITCGYVARKGLSAIARNCDILFPLFILSLLLVFIFGVKNSTFTDVFPFQTNITYQSFFQTTQYFGETLIAIFLIPNIAPTKNSSVKITSFKSGKTTFICSIIIYTITALIFIEFLMSFGSASFLKKFAITSLTANKNKLSRADFFPTLYMLSGVIIHISMLIYICLNLLCHAFKTTHRTLVCVVISIILLFFSSVFSNNFPAVLTLFEMINPIILIFTYVIPLLLCLILKIKSVKTKSNETIKTGAKWNI